MQGMVTSSMGLLSKSIKPSILAAASMFTSYNWIYIISLPALSVEIDDFYQNCLFESSLYIIMLLSCFSLAEVFFHAFPNNNYKTNKYIKAIGYISSAYNSTLGSYSFSKLLKVVLNDTIAITLSIIVGFCFLLSYLALFVKKSFIKEKYIWGVALTHATCSSLKLYNSMQITMPLFESVVISTISFLSTYSFSKQNMRLTQENVQRHDIIHTTRLLKLRVVIAVIGVILYSYIMAFMKTADQNINYNSTASSSHINQSSLFNSSIQDANVTRTESVTSSCLFNLTTISFGTSMAAQLSMAVIYFLTMVFLAISVFRENINSNQAETSAVTPQ